MSDFKLDYIIEKLDKIDDRVRKLEIKNASIATIISGVITVVVIGIGSLFKWGN